MFWGFDDFQGFDEPFLIQNGLGAKQIWDSGSWRCRV